MMHNLAIHVGKNHNEYNDMNLQDYQADVISPSPLPSPNDPFPSSQISWFRFYVFISTGQGDVNPALVSEKMWPFEAAKKGLLELVVCCRLPQIPILALLVVGIHEEEPAKMCDSGLCCDDKYLMEIAKCTFITPKS